MPKLPGFVGGSYNGVSPQQSSDRTINLYPETNESGVGKNPSGALVGTPGLVAFGAPLAAPIRGLWGGEGRLFAAGGSNLYEIFADGTSSNLGSIGGGTGPVQMFPNGNQLGIVAGGLWYVATGVSIIQPTFPTVSGVVNTVGTAVSWVSGDNFEPDLVGQTITINSVGYTVASVAADNNSLVLTTSAGAQSAVSFSYALPVTASAGAYFDGYFVIARPNSRQINISSINDGLTWSTLDFAEKEAYPDNIATLLADHEQLWILGTQTSEVWQDTGNNNFPLVRDPGGMTHIGALPDTAVRIGQQVGFLGVDPKGWVMAMMGTFGAAQRVSNHAVEYRWSQYATVSDAEAFSYVESGHQFWVINFPTGNATWVYDATTNLWHERGFWNGTGFDRIRARCHAFEFEKHIVGDWQTGQLYQSSIDIFTDNGTEIVAKRICPHLSDDGNWLFPSRMRLDMEYGSNLTVTLDWSDDGGHNFSKPIAGSTPAIAGNAEVANGTPETIVQQAWRRLGRSRDRVYEFTVSGNSRKVLINAYVEMAA